MKRGSVYEFGPYRQDTAARILTRQGTPVAITPKTFDALLYLVSNAGRPVTREEMIRAVWPDTFVEEGNLNYNISQIRKILDEYEPGVPYIQTLPKHGYCFIAQVNQVHGGAKEPTAETRESLPSPRLAQPKRVVRMWAAVVLIPLVVATVTTWFLLEHKDATKTGALLQMTFDSGLTMTPALSPDGKLIAYASERGGEGNLDIWVQQVGGGGAVRLTQDPANEYAPSFSPDGHRIAFRSEREGGGVYVVSALGGEVRKVAPYGRRPRYSPDGKWITYWVGIEAWDTSSFFLTPGAGKVYIVPSGGGAPVQLQPDFAAAGYPVWAPDSRHILFLGTRDSNEFHEQGSVDWWVTPIEGGPVKRTGASTAFRNLGFATVSQAPEVWTPDGMGVLISAVAADTRNLWQVPISLANWTVSGAPRRLTFGTSMDVQPSIAGNHLVFGSLHGNVDVWSLPIDADRAEVAGGLERLTEDPPAHGYPAVSVDGGQLAFSSRRSGSRDIWMKNLQTGAEKAVSISPGPSFNPSFSPDGLNLLYRLNANQTSAGYLVSLADGTAERICEDCTDYGWSSDQKRLLLVGASPARISLLDLASKQRTALLNHPEYVLWNPRFSPDDRWIVFNATTLDRSRIFVAPFRNAGLIPEREWIAITDSASDENDKPRWSPDGNTLYFVSKRDGFLCIWAQRLDARKRPAGPAIPVFHAHDARRSLANVGIGDLGISVARNKIVFNMSERTGNVWMMNLDGAR